MCPECGHEWNPEELAAEAAKADQVVDVNGNELLDGDTVVVIKDLPVKGAPKPVNAGTITTPLLSSTAKAIFSVSDAFEMIFNSSALNFFKSLG